MPIKPFDIPDAKWSKPVTAVKAEGNLPKGTEKAVVTYVVDGDTAYLNRGDGTKIQCRIDSIEAPEVAQPKHGKPRGQPYGEESRKTLQDMILNKEVNLRVTQGATAKNYGRSLCQIEIEGVDIGKAMLQKGATWLYSKYGNTADLVDAEFFARKNKIGLWGLDNPVHPRDFKYRQ